MTTTRVQHPEPEKRESGERSGIARVRPMPEHPCTTPDALLRLQCAAGNAAVASVVGARPGRPSPGNGPSSSPPVVARQPQEEDGGGSWLTAALAMREKLSGVLGRAGDVVGDIVAHPVRFLTNLVTGVRGGIFKFQANIVDHLRRGLVGWLFGALAEGGVEVPSTLDGKGIVSLLSSVFGLTWSHIRSRVTRQIGETAMAAVERGVQIFQILATEGVSGLWQMLLAKLGDVKEMLLGQVREFVISKVITAGITWLISALNPAGALVKALKLIYDGIMFFIDNGSRLAAFVNTVLDSLSDVARGSVGVVVDKVEGVLGRTVPILIDAFARVLGLGVGRQIRSIVQTVQKPVDKALDVMIAGGLKLAGPIIRGSRGVSGAVKAKVALGAAWVKDQAEKGKDWAKKKAYGSDDSAEGKQKRLDKALNAGVASVNRLPGSRVAEATLKPILASIRFRYGLAALVGIRSNGRWVVHGELNPKGQKETAKKVGTSGADVEKAKKLVGTRVKAINSKGRQHDATVYRLDEAAKRVSLEYSEPRGRQRLVRLAHATLKDLLDSVIANQPVPLKDLRELTHPSRFVENVNGRFLLVKELRQTVDGKRGGWRGKLYGGFSSEVERWKMKMLSTPYTQNDVKNGIMEPADSNRHVTNRRYWARGTRYNPKDGPRFIPTIDHDPAVVEHWNTGAGGTRPGRDGVQLERRAFFSAGDFEILPQFLNSSEGAGGKTLDPEVGPDFRGPGED